jgi:hypothetical protein
MKKVQINIKQIGFADEYFAASPEMFQAAYNLHKEREGSMKKTYICVHVYDDGDNELTKLELGPMGIKDRINGGGLCFDAETQVKELTHELLEYGNDPGDVKEALTYILNVAVGESCIVGKV